ncbi:MAG: TIGR03790 family protein [Bryobacteraceae bacterium]
MCLAFFAALAEGQIAPLNQRVLVVYDAGISESRAVAGYYMEKRNIPEGNSCKIKTSSTDIIDQAEFESHVKAPIRKCLEAIGKDKILYIVFSYATPFALEMNGGKYALDAFVSDIWDEFLPFRPAAQSEVQPYFGYAQSEGNLYVPFASLATYRESSVARHLYSVWRIDAANPALAKGLVDKALFAEAHGLSGKGCFDLTGSPAGVADYGYGTGNWDIYQAEHFARKAGFLILDDTHEQEFGTPPAPLRCDGAALYAGWYSLNHYNDAFTWNPGAIGIHLDSASAMDPRSGLNWAANAIIKGLTLTSGAVAEPYLENLPHPDQAFFYLMQGANAGDALLRSTRLLKWMIINIGDPLYRPFPNGATVKTPGAPEVILALTPQLTLGGASSGAILALNAPAPEGGVTFAMQTNPPGVVDVPSSVSIPAGVDHVRFSIHAKEVHDDGVTVRIIADSKELSRSNTLIIFPLLAAPVVSPAKVRGRSSSMGKVQLRRAAPSGGITIALSTNNPGVAGVPSEIKVPEGQNSATFEITTHGVTAENAVTITASYEGVARTATLTVVP